MKTTVKINGMMCMHCVKRVENALNALSGVKATVNLETRQAVLQSETAPKKEDLITAIENLGFEVEEII